MSHLTLHLHSPHPRFDEDLWSLLADKVKIRIISDDIRQHKNKHEPYLENLETHNAARKNRFLRAAHNVWTKILTAFFTKPNYREAFNLKYWWFQRLTKRLRVFKFFSPFSDHLIDEPESAISAMALICALILTVPFWIFGLFKDSYITDLKDSIDICPGHVNKFGESFHDAYRTLLLYPSVTMYTSLMGLIMSSIYFIFKPSKGRDLDKWCRKQGRLLMLILFVLCVIAVTTLCACAANLLKHYTILFVDHCSPDDFATNLWVPGASACAAAFVVALIGMWWAAFFVTCTIPVIFSILTVTHSFKLVMFSLKLL